MGFILKPEPGQSPK